MTRRAPASWLTDPVFGWRDIGAGDIALAVALSAYAVALTSGVITSSHPHGGVAASLAVLTMTVPVAFARRWPLPSAATLAIGAALNWALIGDMVRCGAALPAVFYVAFMVGNRCPRRNDAVLGMAFLVVNLFCQGESDPQLGGPGVLVLMVPVSVGFLFAGRLVRARNLAISRLQARTAELREQREQNARLAVAADQARIADGLDDFLHDRVGQIAAAAVVGRAALDEQPDQAELAFVAIQASGREALTHMRGVVAGLHDQSPTEPQPVLAQLDRLLGQATQADARLQVAGDPRLLPPGVELSGYRIIEHLLVALENDPTARTDVVVAFGPDTLELTVTGPASRRVNVRSALAAVTERAALHGGSVRTQASGGRRETVVLLPLVGGGV